MEKLLVPAINVGKLLTLMLDSSDRTAALAGFGDGFLRLLGPISICSAMLLVNGCGLVNDDGAAMNAGGSGSYRGAGGQSTGVSGDSGTVNDSGAPLIPADNRPLAPTWQPPIPLGTVGWKQSTVPFCDTHQQEEYGYYVWADDQGVWALVQTDCALVSDISVKCDATGMGLQFNDGTSWQWVYGDSRPLLANMQMRGFPGGPIILLGYDSATNASEGAVTFVDGGIPSTQPPSLGDYALNGTVVMGAFAVGPAHAYFVNLLNDDGYSIYRTAIHEYQNGVWSTLATLPFYGRAIWADANTIVVVGNDQAVYRRTNGSSEFTPLPNVPAGNYYSVWGFGGDNLWMTNSEGQLVHFNGNTWQVSPINTAGQLWGVDGELFSNNGSVFSHWNGTDLETLIGSDAGIVIKDMWGRSKNEIFLAVNDSAFAGYKCGQNFLVWYDGSTFHRF